MNFGIINTQGPLVLVPSMIIGVIKIVQQCSDFLYSPWFKRYVKKPFVFKHHQLEQVQREVKNLKIPMLRKGITY